MDPQAILASLQPADRDLMQQRGISEKQLARQLQYFQEGFPPLELLRPASLGDGVSRFSEDEVSELIRQYESQAAQLKICKFVPASGAASRMFRLLYAHLQQPEALAAAQKREIQLFFAELEHFAFYPDLARAAQRVGLDLDELEEEKQFATILRLLLTEEGLNYGQLPKLLLQFHRYKGEVRTPALEHMVEGAHYAVGRAKEVQLHFTVSPEHQPLVKEHLKAYEIPYSARYAVSFSLSTSTQNPATDTIAVDMTGQPFRMEQGGLLFRPGGHGALLENLNQIEADLVFIKNVDNIVPDDRKGPTYHYKKLIAGVLLRYQQRLFHYLQMLEASESPDESLQKEIIHFLQDSLCTTLPPEANHPAVLHQALNRPIRVCGVIRTEDNTGGGPFWVRDKAGRVSLQLVESAQLEPGQQAMAARSTYANITDLVCGLRDYMGNKFDLLAFRDDSTGFITTKSVAGKQLQALELPGLWNGSMAGWHSVLVEVPVSTFAPVKSVMDLLGPAHRGEH